MMYPYLTLNDDTQTIATAYCIGQDYTEWTDQGVESRQKELAKEAVKVFPVEQQKLFEVK